MTFTAPDPTAGSYPSARNRVRSAVGDIDGTVNPALLVPDELIDYWIGAFGEARATIETINYILARYAREADTGTRSASLEATRRFERLLQLRKILLERQATTVTPGAATSAPSFMSAPYLSNATGAANRADGDLNQGSRIRIGSLDADLGD